MTGVLLDPARGALMETLFAVAANPRDWSGGGLDRQHRSGRDQRARTVAFLPPQAGRHDCGRGVAVGLDGRSSW